MVTNSVFTNGELKIDYVAGCVYMGDGELHLTPIEYKLLCLLSRNVGKVLTHTFITREIWAARGIMMWLRCGCLWRLCEKRLRWIRLTLEYIQTHVGVGYRMLRV